MALTLFLVIIILSSLGVFKGFHSSDQVENIINKQDEVDWDYVLDFMEDSNISIVAGVLIGVMLY